MRTRTPITAHLLLSICTAAVAFAGCSGDRNTGGTKIRLPRDGGSGVVLPRDGGDISSTRDAGPNPCANNNCAPFQQVGAPPACECLAACEPGYTWNAITMMCDSNNPTRDGGVNNPTRDGGVAMGACTMDTQCQGMNPDGVCIFVDAQNMVSRCAGQGTCQCAIECEPFSTMGNTCGQGNGCLWLGPGTAVTGLCQQDGMPGQGGHNQACQTMYDLGGMRAGDTCNNVANTYCWSTVAPNQQTGDPGIPNGTCASFCDDQAAAGWCESFGAYNCDPVGPVDGIGLCLGNAPGYTDLGNSCTTPNECQGSQCSAILANSCVAACDGLNSCPANSVCLYLGPPAQGGEGLRCIPECTFGQDTACSNRNPELICERLGTSPNTFDVCIPRCTTDADCGGTTCNTATGHCS